MRFIHLTLIIASCLLCSVSFAQYIGEVDTVGTTYQDCQHIGSCGRMIRVDIHGNIHVVWTNLMSGSSYHRNVFYNMRNSTGWLWDTTGTSVESSQRAGYTCLAVDSEGSPYPAFQVVTSYTNPDAEAAIAVDWFPGYGLFNYWQCPFVYQGGTLLEVIWPKIAIDIDDRVHIVNTENPLSGEVGAPMRVYYIGGEYDSNENEFSWDDSQTVVDWTVFISADIAASRHSERVAFVYTHIRDDYPYVSYFNNDIFLFVSEDGINWDFERPINVTNFIPPDSLGHAGDTLRVYTDASILFDSDDNIHVAFTTIGYYALQGEITINNSLIYHWNDLTENYGLIADGWFDTGPGSGFTLGARQTYVQRPCLAEDESTGDLYCTYMLYDTSDIATNNYPQGEVIITRSSDHGDNWAVGTNVSNSHAPGVPGTNHRSERDITCNETVENNALHLFYLLDTWAGNSTQQEEYSLCPVFYHSVPVDLIAQSPMLPPYPMHIDSTGYPSLSVRDNENANIPTSFHLAQNYPNPFNPTTMIQFDLHRTDHVIMKTYNVLGREIATLVDANLSPGTYKVPFTADNLSSGIYFYTLQSSTLTQTRKMVLLK